MLRLVEQLMRFAALGVATAVVDFGLLALLTEICGVGYLVSATISFTASVIFNYMLSMRYVFRHRDELSRTREFVIFAALSAVGLAINNVVLWAGVELFGLHYMIAKVIASILVPIWNFVSRKLILDAGEEPLCDLTDDEHAAQSVVQHAGGGRLDRR